MAEIQRCLTRFVRDERGAAGVEFLAASPLLVGALIFTAEYGQALRHRIALDGAVQDIARYLARAPVRAVTDAEGRPSIAFYDHFLAEADAMLDARLGRDAALSHEVTTVDTANFRTPFHVVEVTGSLTVDMPLLGFIDVWTSDDLATSLTMTAVQQARWEGEAPPGAVHCAFRDRYAGRC